MNRAHVTGACWQRSFFTAAAGKTCLCAIQNKVQIFLTASLLVQSAQNFMAHGFLECLSDTDHLISCVIDGVMTFPAWACSRQELFAETWKELIIHQRCRGCPA